jgi:hypothetical protein
VWSVKGIVLTKAVAPALTLVAVVALAACGGSAEPERAAPTSTSSSGPQRYQVDTTVLEDATHGPQACLGGELTSLPPQCGGPDVVGLDWADVQWKEHRYATTWAGVHLVGTYDGDRFTLTEAPTRVRDADDEPDSNVDFSPACDHPDVVDANAGFAKWEAVAADGRPPIDHLVAVWVSDPGGAWDGPFVANVVVQPGARKDAEARVRAVYKGPLCVVERDAPTEPELRTIQSEISALGDTSPLGRRLDVSVDARHSKVNVGVVLADDAAITYAQQRWGDVVVLHGRLEPVP